MSKKLASLMLCTASATALAAAIPAQAQNFERNRNVSVRERPQPAYDPVGVPLGPFRAYAVVPIGVSHTDNVFASETNEQSDTIFTIAPTLDLLSQFNRHSLNLRATADHMSYSDFEDESRTNFTMSADAGLDILRTTQATLSATQGWFEEPRTDSNTPDDAAEPVEYTETDYSAGLSHEFSRLMLSGSVRRSEFDFDDALDAMSAPIEQDDRDRQTTQYRVRADYAYTPTFAVFASVQFTENDYDILTTGPGGAFSRDSEGTSYFVGADFDITRLARGEIAVGALEWEFADPNTPDEDGVAASASVEWFPTEVATVEFSASRSVAPSGVIGTSGSVATEYGVRVDYELRRNVIVAGQANFREDDFTGAVDRTDEGAAYGVDATYLINRHLGVSANLTRLERTSSGANAGMEFDENRAGVRLVLRY